MSGMAKMPNWASKLFGGPLMRSIDRRHRLLSVPVRQRVSRRDQGGVRRELNVIAFVVGGSRITRDEISNVPSSLTELSPCVEDSAVFPGQPSQQAEGGVGRIGRLVRSQSSNLPLMT